MAETSVVLEDNQPRAPLRSLPLAFRPTAIQLPAPLSSFVGRASEIVFIVDLLQRPGVRLVTLTGPGGVGKSRLALEVAESVAFDFPDGVVFVSLEGTRRPADMSRTVAAALGLIELAGQDPADAVRTCLQDRTLLLVLDNFEHLIEAAPKVAEWLTSCRWLSILVTSQAGLRLRGEHELAVHPLELPVRGQTVSVAQLNQTEAVRLFVERASERRHDFALTPENAETIVAICSRLEGLPLAIELAAARMQHLSPESLLDLLARRLPVLTQGSADQPVRLQSMEDAAGWSYDLLSPGEQRLFRNLAVFTGGFTLPAAEAINDGDQRTFEEIGSLVGKSLVVPMLVNGRETRYRMLEPLREFAFSKLCDQGEEQVIRTAHAQYFTELAERLDETIWGGPLHKISLDQLETELPNLRSALDWLDAIGEGATLVRLAAALGGLWFFRSHRIEGRAWLLKSLSMGDRSVPAARATALVKLTLLELGVGGSPPVEWANEAVELRLPLGNDRALASALTCQGMALERLGEIEAAEQSFAQAKLHFDRSGELAGMAWGKYRDGVVAVRRGDLDKAVASLREALALFRRDGFAFGVSQALNMLGDLEAERGNREVAGQRYRESLLAFEESLSQERFLDTLAGTGRLAASSGQWETGAQLLGAAASLGAAIGYTPSASRRERTAAAICAINDQLGDEQFELARQSGATLTLDRALEECGETLVSLQKLSEAKEIHTHSAPGGLTGREVEVVRLMASGRSNREIAEALHVSQSTAISHVRNILAKLDLDSRSAVAAWAVRNGLD